MKLHGNAALSWQGRRRLATRVVEEGWTLSAAAASAGVSMRCARKWVSRYREEGERGLRDRSSAPKRVANRTPPERVEAIMALRRLRFTAAEIAEALGMALSTVSAILRRVGMGRLGRLGLEQPVRYERTRPGELVHVDVKKLGRIAGGAGKRVRGGVRGHYTGSRIDREGKRRNTVGWEYVHIAVDDFSRLAYAEVLADERASTAVGFLRRAVAFYRRHGVHVERVLSERLGLPLDDPRARVPLPRHPAPAHSPVQAADEREGGALHPHSPAGLGVRSDLRLERRADGGT